MSDACEAEIREYLNRIDACLERAGHIAEQGAQGAEHAARELAQGHGPLKTIQEDLEGSRSAILGLQARIQELESLLRQKEAETSERTRALRARFSEFHDREIRTRTAQLSAHYDQVISKLEAEILRRDQIILELKRMMESTRPSSGNRQEALSRLPGIWNGSQRDQ